MKGATNGRNEEEKQKEKAITTGTCKEIIEKCQGEPATQQKGVSYGKLY